MNHEKMRLMQRFEQMSQEMGMPTDQVKKLRALFFGDKGDFFNNLSIEEQNAAINFIVFMWRLHENYPEGNEDLILSQHKRIQDESGSIVVVAPDGQIIILVSNLMALVYVDAMKGFNHVEIRYTNSANPWEVRYYQKSDKWQLAKTNPVVYADVVELLRRMEPSKVEYFGNLKSAIDNAFAFSLSTGHGDPSITYSVRQDFLHFPDQTSLVPNELEAREAAREMLQKTVSIYEQFRLVSDKVNQN